MQLTDVESTVHLFLNGWGYESAPDNEVYNLFNGIPGAVYIFHPHNRFFEDVSELRELADNEKLVTTLCMRMFYTFRVPSIFFRWFAFRWLFDSFLERWLLVNIIKPFNIIKPRPDRILRMRFHLHDTTTYFLSGLKIYVAIVSSPIGISEENENA
jgi:hypothetical protein